MLLAPVFLFAAGCDRVDTEVQQYKIPKDRDVFDRNHMGDARYMEKVAEAPRATAKSGKKARLLAAMIVDGSKSWFFKALGPPDQVDAAKFRQLIDSVRFAGGKPTWTLPDGWRQLPDDDPKNSAIRIATLYAGTGDDAVEVPVTTLATMGDSPEDWVLRNVNRWRGEVGMKHVTAANLYRQSTDAEKQAGQADEVVKTEVDGRPAVFIHLLGVDQGRSRMPPFMQR